jgi:glycosyltransferase involved in cell wall biosynthesis
VTTAPEVTVVVTTLNRRGWLERCVESVLGQDGVTFELVIVDDGSTDATEAYLNTLDDPRASVIRHAAPSGPHAARNSGLAAATGGLVMFLDDDDWLERGALQALHEGLDEHPETVAAIGARRVWFTTEGYARRDSHPHITRIRNVLDDLLAGWSTISGQNLYRTALVRHVGGFDTSLEQAEDRDLWLRIAVLGPVVLRPEVVTTYRVHPGQSRLPHIRDLREDVALKAIRALPPDEQPRALRIRRTTRLLDEAEIALTNGRVSSGVADTLRAVANTPTLFLSPLVGPWTVRRLAGRLARRFVLPARA